MRIASNPAKSREQLAAYGRHRVIIPVYIPNFDGYFKDALRILRLCLDSICATTRDKAAVSVISNGCTPEVVALLGNYVERGFLDKLVVNKHNRGKVDAIISEMRGSFEQLLTITDADVLFYPGWLETVEQIFAAFPEAGIVSPVPNPWQSRYHTSATRLASFVRGEFRFEKIVDERDLERFIDSVGYRDYYDAHSEEKHRQAIVRRGGSTACVGCGHFVMSLRRECLAATPSQPSLQSLFGGGASADRVWLDQPADRLGYWRLASPRAFAYHMGNVPEEWMIAHCTETVEHPDTKLSRPVALPPIKRTLIGRLPEKSRQLILELAGRTGITKGLFRLSGISDSERK